MHEITVGLEEWFGKIIQGARGLSLIQFIIDPGRCKLCIIYLSTSKPIEIPPHNA
jgi:hypothetical protein